MFKRKVDDAKQATVVKRKRHMWFGKTVECADCWRKFPFNELNPSDRDRTTNDDTCFCPFCRYKQQEDRLNDTDDTVSSSSDESSSDEEVVDVPVVVQMVTRSKTKAIPSK